MSRLLYNTRGLVKPIPAISNRVSQTSQRHFRHGVWTSNKNEQAMGGIFATFEKQETVVQTSVPEENTESEKAPLTVEEVIPSPEILKMLKEKNKLNLPIVEQREILKVVLENLPIEETKPKIQKFFPSDNVAELTNLANAILQHSRDASSVALKLFELAMELGDDTAAYTYASLLLKGFPGVQRDVQSATAIFKRLAVKGHPHAQYNYASILVQTEKDIKSALELFELAGKNGLDTAYAKIADIYRLGQYVEQDIPKALMYFQKAAEKGNAQSNFYLGYYYSIGQDSLTAGSQPDFEKAFECYEKAAVKGISPFYLPKFRTAELNLYRQVSLRPSTM
ncbi:hypothetical protein K7432_003786 [Basidiobolus ranarum]|uniref:Uncharacterized protein n=1 Tax=Basidiobolus ranarum TaxID=34480 RepID=A0ABR2W630_9FUNG